VAPFRVIFGASVASAQIMRGVRLAIIGICVFAATV
jgi:hypothetical protein